MNASSGSPAPPSPLLDLLFESDGIGRCLVAPDGRVLRANTAWLRSMAQSAGQVVGAHIADVLPLPREEAVARCDRARAGSRVDVRLRAQATDGGEAWRDASIQPVSMDGGVGLLVTTGGILDELRTREARFRALADGTPIMIWSTDAVGRVQFVNRAYCEYFGVSQEAVVTNGWQPFVHPEDEPGFVRAFQTAVANRAPFHAEVRVRHADGGWRWIESFGRPQLDAAGNLVSMTGSSPDVTERKQAEEAVRQADRQKTEFLAILSHELRNPLAPIRNSIVVLDRAEPGSPKAGRAMEILRRQADQLTRLVDDLLDLSRITYGKLHVELAPADARELVRRAHVDAKVLYDERGIGLDLLDSTDPIWIDADPPRFAQMLGNLLHNALKFTAPGGLVELGVSRRGDACVISVKDDGRGLAAKDLERIFDPFEQGSTVHGSMGGLGLGLALVKRLATKHRGTVHARSEGRGKGTEFVIELPLAVVGASRANGHGVTRRSGGASMQVLVVEDNEDAAATLADLLTLVGHRVTTTATGAGAVRAVATEAPDVLICDIGLPDTSGYDVIRAVRAGEKGRRVFAVALTGHAHARDREEALAAGFDAHLPKPPPLEELEALLRTANPAAER